MSTRTQIRIKEIWQNENHDIDCHCIDLYHHHDGYPEGVGKDLKERIKRLGNHGYQWAGHFANQCVKDANDEYEVTFCNHDDIEYIYEIVFSWIDETIDLRCYLRKYKENYRDIVAECKGKEVEIPD